MVVNRHEEAARSFIEALGDSIPESVNVEVFRRVCMHISANRGQFGKGVLALGCRSGLTDCFIARLFPKSTVTALVASPEAVATAQQIAAKLELGNISFAAGNPSDVEGTFDTVFCMNLLAPQLAEVSTVPCEYLAVQANAYRDAVADAARVLFARTAVGGRLVALEEAGRDARFFGIARALTNAGLRFDPMSYAELACGADECARTFQTFCMRRFHEEGGLQRVQRPLDHHEERGVGFTSRDDNEGDANSFFYNACARFMDPYGNAFEGWNARTVFEQYKGSLLKGFDAIDPSTGTRGRYSVWTRRYDDSVVMVMICVGEKANLDIYPIDAASQILQELDAIAASLNGDGIETTSLN